MLPIERRNEILTKLTLEGKVIVADLAQHYNVTEETKDGFIRSFERNKEENYESVAI